MRRGRRPYPELLTPREQEVLDLLREGLTNPEIAARLGISLNGAKYHVSEILAKLQVESRDEAAAWHGDVTATAPHRRFYGMAAAFMHRLTAVPPYKLAAGAVIAAAAAGLAILAFGVFSMSHREADLGRIAYIHDGDVWVKDLPDGEARQLTTGGYKSNPQWSGDGEWLSYVDNHGVGNTLHLVRRDGTDDQSLDRWEQFSWSPTNHQFTYVAFGGGLAIGEPLGKTTEVTSGDGTSHWVLADSPVWSPNGKSIAFIRDERKGVGLDTCCETNYGIWTVDVASTTFAMNELYRHDVLEEGGPRPFQQGLKILGWNGDGSSVYFVPLARGGPEGVERLFSVSRNGGSPRSIGVQAFVSQEGFRSSLHLQDYTDFGPGGGLALVVGEGYPAWTNKKAVKVDSTGHVVEVTGDGEVGLSPAWAQDGRMALVLQPDLGTLSEYSDYRGDWPITADLAPTGREQRRIWLLSKDGKSLERLTEDSVPEERPQWSTDGRHIVFMTPRSGESLLGPASIRLYDFSTNSTKTLAEVDTFIDYGAGGEVSAVKMPIDFLGHRDWDAVFDWWQPSPND